MQESKRKITGTKAHTHAHSAHSYIHTYLSYCNKKTVPVILEMIN